MSGIIHSLLDNDLYKFTMMNAVFHQCPGTDVEYEFKCRNNVEFSEELTSFIRMQIMQYCDLTFRGIELEFLSDLGFFHRDFIDFLSMYKPNYDHIDVSNKGKELVIKIKGSWLLTILFEVPVLAIVSEMTLNRTEIDVDFFDEATKRIRDKIDVARDKQFKIADFGTRRRFSVAWQDRVIDLLTDTKDINFVGTSNVYFAMRHGIKPIGTMAHEWVMGFQGMNVRLENSQKKALQVWADEYRGDLGIALSDTVGFDAFLRDFDKYFCKLYDGVRHDSGDPVEWGEKMISHYESMGIDPKTKQLVFSDGLDFVEAGRINDIFKDRTNPSFGIGTNLMNDLPGVTPLQIVIKMTQCNGNSVAKISDEPGKTMCKDKEFLTHIKSVFGHTA